MSRNSQIIFFYLLVFPVFLKRPFDDLSCTVKSLKMDQFPSNVAHCRLIYNPIL